MDKTNHFMPQTQSESQRTMTVLEEIYQQRDPPAETAQRPPRRRRLSGVAWSRAVAPLTVLLGVVSLGVGAAQLRDTIRSPALRFAQLAQVAPSLRDFAARENLLLDAGPTTDTDGDRLPDAQEKTLGTSAYLEDTDSDGVSDGDEVRAGTDPTCASGEQCGGPLPTPLASPSPSGSPGIFPSPNAGFPGVAPAGDLRQRLLQEGMPPELLQDVTDQQLQELLGIFGGPGSAAAPGLGVVGGAAASRSVVAPSSPQDLRRLLQERGVPADVISSISDAELLQLAEEARTSGANAGGR